MTHRAHALVLSLSCAALAGSCAYSSSPECEQACERFIACGFAPSLLAPGREGNGDLIESCAERCTVSESELADEIKACASFVRTESKTLWCAKDMSKGSACEQAATCLRSSVAEHVPIIGVAELRLEARLARGGEGAPVDLEPERECRAAGAEPEQTAAPVRAQAGLCEALGVDCIAYFVKQNSAQPDATRDFQDCVVGMERGAAFDVEPGPVTAGITLARGDCRKPDAFECEATYYAPSSILRAGSAVELPVFLPENDAFPRDRGCRR